MENKSKTQVDDLQSLNANQQLNQLKIYLRKIFQLKKLEKEEAKSK